LERVLKAWWNDDKHTQFDCNVPPCPFDEEKQAQASSCKVGYLQAMPDTPPTKAMMRVVDIAKDALT